MRFTENGPSIPNDLLDARDAGEVVFLCGAGVSIPAGLPDFFKLTLQVAHGLGAQADSPAGQLIETENRYRTTEALRHPHHSISFDRIFTFLEREFGIAQVEREVATALAPKRHAKLDGHRALLDIARGPDGRQRLITTNFDRLFQKAQAGLHSYVPPHLPDISKRNGFNGVVHLHGLLPPSAERLSGSLGLVLSSGDFGRAYLADAWATRFIRDVLDRYIVVLLGYSADDPPVRYLLEGLNLAGRIRERRLYAFAAGDNTQITADWRERGVTAITYDSAEEHRNLWDSIHLWAERARDLGAWRKQVTALAATSPRKLKPFERGQVAALCSSTEGAREFASAAPPPPAEWLCVFDAFCRYQQPGRDINYSSTPSPEIDPLAEYGLDDDPPRPQGPRDEQRPLGINVLSPLSVDNPVARESAIVTMDRWARSDLNARLFQIGRWIQSVMPSPTSVWWVASRGALHPNLHEQLCWTLDRQAPELDPVVRRAWRLVLESIKSAPSELGDGWWVVQSQIQREGWTARTIREFSKATRPRLTVQRPWAYAPMPPDEMTALTLSPLGNFEVHYPKLIEKTAQIPDSALSAILEAIRVNLKLGSALESEISQVNLRLPSLYPENKPGEHIYTDSEEYYVQFARLFERLAVFDATAARREYLRWDETGRFFVALRIWALANPKIVTAAEVGRALRELDRDTFWDSDHARELLWAVRARWSDLSKRDRLAIESKILRGRRKFDFETDAEYAEHRASLIAERLVWMQDAGLTLSSKTISHLPALKKANPRWRDSWAKAADASLESRSGFVKRETDPSPIASLPISAVIARCDELSQREFESFTDRDPFRGLVATSPARAMAVLNYEGWRKNYPQRYWSRLLSDWPKSVAPRLLLRLAKALCGLPSPIVVQVRFDISRWIAVYFERIDKLDRSLGHLLFDHIMNSLEAAGAEALKSGLGRTSVGGVEIASNRMGVDYAINSPSGDVAQGLVNALFGRKPKSKERIAKDLKQRLQRLLGLPEEGGHHALTIIAQQLHGLYVIDPKWSRMILLPRFDPDQASAEAAWSGFLRASQMPSPALFNELKAYFLGAIAASPRWKFQGITHLAQALVLALEPLGRRKPLLSCAEARAALQSASAGIRLEALSFLRSRAAIDGAWSKLVVPFFRKAWPREKKFQSDETTRMLLLFVQGLGSRFPDGVNLVADFLVPSTQTDVFVFQFGHEGEHSRTDLSAEFPDETLFLLDKVIDTSHQRAPYGLMEVLTRIAHAAPELRHDDRWQRLHHLTIG